jgi:hypothetical protein
MKKSILFLGLLALLGCDNTTADEQLTMKEKEILWVKATESLPNKNKSTIDDVFMLNGRMNTPQEQSFLKSKGYNVLDSKGNNRFMFSVSSINNYYENHGSTFINKHLSRALDNGLDVNHKNNNGDTLLSLTYSIHKLSIDYSKGKENINGLEVAIKKLKKYNANAVGTNFSDYVLQATSTIYTNSYYTDYINNGTMKSKSEAVKVIDHYILENFNYIMHLELYPPMQTHSMAAYSLEELSDLLVLYYKKSIDTEPEYHFSNNTHDLYLYMKRNKFTISQIRKFASDIYAVYHKIPQSYDNKKETSIQLIGTTSTTNGIQYDYRCAQGKTISIFKDGNYITGWRGRSLSTTIHRMSVEQAARYVCNE